jgi:rhodanese-related sulfurtransferase/glyoxylase-like metal-dependent hydrolase (beta-lactamase superfamily II)
MLIRLAVKAVIAILLIFGLGTPSIRPLWAAGPIKDTESASHAFEAAGYQVKDTHQFPGFKVIQFELGVLSHYSYLLVSGKEALVIDPGRDVTAYVEMAKKEGAILVGVYLTHSHADFVAGHGELAKLAPIHVAEKTGAKYQHKPFREGDTLTVGDAILKFLETPGHTPDGTCAVVANKQNPDKPLMIFTGDTLFIGSVGRPDLLGEGMAASTLASMMFDTWNNKLAKLPDDVKVLPAHGAGSLCGAHLSDAPSSTLGEQRTSNPYLSHKSRGEFVAAVLEGLPEAPQYFKHNAQINHDGPELVDWEPKSLRTIRPEAALTDPNKYFVVDIRGAADYSRSHIPNSVNIDLRGRFETWVGIVVPWDATLVLCGNEKDLREALFRLHRVGYNRTDNPVACLTFDEWTQAGLPTKTNPMVAPLELHAQMQSKESPVVLDVRQPNEWMGLRIGTVVNIPLSELAAKARKLDRKQPVVAVCNSAYRSNMAVGILERSGFEQPASLAGGSEAWISAGLPVIEAKKDGSSGGAKREIQLAERMSAAELKRLLMDLPGTFQLFDIRPASQFADYSLPGSQNVDISDVLNNPVYLTGAGPLIIVDRDGSLAMMAGGILSQKTKRSIKVLHGGLSAYWSATELGGAASPAVTPIPVKMPKASPENAPATPPAAKETISPPKPKKKSAGC